MPEPFLYRVAAHVLAHSSDAPEKTAVILPSQRAAVYFRKHFSQQVTGVQFAPHLLTLDQLVTDCSSLEMADQIELLFQLYRSHKEVWQSEAEPFDRFLKWAPLALADFSEIDAYLADPKAFFRDLTNLKELEGWSLNEEELTTTQQNYAWFWKKIGDLYFHFTAALKKEGLAYAGMLFRDVAENIHTAAKLPAYEKLFFCGFNALSASEEKIMQFFVDSGQAEMLWDADRFYMDYSEHEAGMFLLKNLKKFPAFPNWTGQYLSENNKTITISAAPNEVAQCDVMANLLKHAPEISQTAVILANENLLAPVLNAIPDEVDKVNVTMGLKTLHSPLHSLFELLFEWMRARTAEGTYYYRYVFRLLGHPYLNFSPDISRSTNRLVAHIKSQNKVFIHPDELESMGAHADISRLFKTIAPDELSAANQLQSQFALLRLILTTLEGRHEYPIEKEHLYHYVKALRRIEQLAARYPDEMKGEAYPRIFGALTAGEKLNFVGEPLEGLQVMGMLESRTLDFRTLIILSCNEHVMPGNNTQQSLVPFDLKKYYHLPGRTEKEAIYAYYFYRLLQRAENVHLLYSTDSNSWQGSEPSRYLAQIDYDFKDIEKVVVKRTIARTVNPLADAQPVAIPKSPEVLQALQERLERGLSPSAFNTYLQCPLDFYYKYILGFKEVDEVEETIEFSTLGTAVHNVLEKLYTEHLNKGALSAEVVAAMRKEVRAMTRTEFDEVYSANATNYGINNLIYEVAVQFIDRFLKQETEELKSLAAENKQVEITGLEMFMEYPMPVDVSTGNFEVKLRGLTDRIDRVGNTVRVIDYKTGMVRQADVTLKNPEEQLHDPGKSKALQLMCYALMYRRQNPGDDPLIAANVSMRNLSNLLLPVQWREHSELGNAQINEFETLLQDIICGMFNTDVPFTHQTEGKYCAFCDTVLDEQE